MFGIVENVFQTFNLISNKNQVDYFVDFLPHETFNFWIHWSASGTLECCGEFFRVHHYSIHPANNV